MTIREYVDTHKDEIESQKNTRPFNGHFNKLITEYLVDIDKGFYIVEVLQTGIDYLYRNKRYN